MTVRCAGCGYEAAWHEQAAPHRCPLETADRNGRRGKWREPPPPGPASWSEVITRDIAARRAAEAAASAPVGPPRPPQVAARQPYGPAEVAGYQGRQAIGLGKLAASRGWRVRADYWRAGDGTESCAVRLRRADLRAVATWTRPPGKIGARSGWGADVAYGWRLGTLPARITHTDLERFIADENST